jgi:hypothetical protein
MDVAEIRDRLDRLAAAKPSTPSGILDRAAALIGPVGEDLLGAIDLSRLEELDRELDSAGVHTLADARLLARLGGRRPGLAVAKGLARRLRRASAGYLKALAAGERVKRGEGRVPVLVLDRLEAGFRMFSRATKVADAFARPQKAADDEYALLPRGGSRPPPRDSRVAAARYFADRAAASSLDLLKKRRDLDVAHEILLSIDSKMDREVVHALRAEVATARGEAHDEARAQTGDAATAVSEAYARGDASAAWTGLVEMYRGAIQSGDSELAAASRLAIEGLTPHIHGSVDGSRDRAALFLQAVGPGPIADLSKRQVSDPKGSANPADELARVAFNLTQERFQVFELAVGAGRFFDVEASETEEVDVDTGPAAGPRHRVPYPTPDMRIDYARSAAEVRDFLIADPRLIHYELANGTQLVRAYFEAPPREARRRVRRGTIRAYVCDASGSMRGARARFRDAVLIAELNNLCVKAARGREFEPLYYSFFNDVPTELQRIESPGQARGLIERLFRESPAAGRTNITYAVEAAFHAIREARGVDPDLARATVVLVTDGEDRVDLETIRAVRAPVGDIEITLNLIQLGEENPDLKALALEQRAHGRRAFYYHLTDAEVRSSRTDFDTGVRTLMPRRADIELAADDPEIRKALDALAAIGRRRRSNGIMAGPKPETRFDALFPREASEGGKGEDALRLRTLDILQAVAEVAALAPAATRAGESVHLMEHLLATYRIPVPTYLKLLTRAEEELMAGVRRVRMISADMTEG